MIIFNEESEDIVEEQHVCYYTSSGKDCDHLQLKEVIKLKLKHPEAHEYAFIYKYEIRTVKEFRRQSVKSGHAVLLEAAQNTTRELHKSY